MTEDAQAKPAGLKGDPIEFAVMTEIGIINQLADNLFQTYLPKGMTVAQFSVLNHLLRLDVQETISELASAMQVAQPTMSSTVRKLEDKGLVELAHEPDDRRIRRVVVTTAGAQLRNDAVAALAPMAEILRQNIPETDWEALLPPLNRIRVFLDQLRN
ncbi:MarR family winged helix-turn-helix transcriptional regulator [Sphingorhabdus sp. EL138]|jgi:DNA-binding MarR family transcriptional regulator|uniref:MarR family winged helix-turn-helix transcriptional regulator n=1 Tax=Sphingorhabdus sp. EL138 TaxID=2073156 RepID=UPI0013A565AE|nr:MarR family winged helix-turn-helix transcriptional regulator [Sphingorhabdus sp. EL138]